MELSASPQAIITGQRSVLSWTSTNASKCTATGAWSGSKPVNGSSTTSTLTTSATYALSCKGRGGTALKNVTVDVWSIPEAPLALRAASGDESITVSWASLAGNSYAGFPVTSNVYVSTTSDIDVRTFNESPPNQVMRGVDFLVPVVFRRLENGVPLYVVATDVANGVESPPSEEFSVTPGPVPSLVEGMVALNDSGVDRCTDLTVRNLSCPQPGLPNQDADQGRDAAAREGVLVKVGFGPAGFDFTKLDENGDPLPNDATTWPCVRDNVTGLIWEVPAEFGLTSAQNMYTWYQPDSMRNGGFSGQPNGGECTGSECDTDAFIRALNEIAHCGFQDWRLPTRRELLSLADLSRTVRIEPNVIVEGVFPNLGPSPFNFIWTGGTSAYTVRVGPHAWAMDLETGKLGSRPKLLSSPSDRPGYVLAVRGN